MCPVRREDQSEEIVRPAAKFSWKVEIEECCCLASYCAEPGEGGKGKTKVEGPEKNE